MYAGHSNPIGSIGVSLTSQQSHGTAEVRQAEVPGMIERLGNRISSLEAALDQMESRLMCVTRGEPQATTKNATPTPVASTSIGSTLQGMGDRVGQMDEKVCSLLRLLEI